jgi:integrase
LAVRKRTWKTATGETKEAWVVDYYDATRKRRFETFERKKDADARAATVKVELRQGVHTPNSASVTIAEAGALWIKSCNGRKLERTTIRDYELSLRLHIEPFIGAVKLSQLAVPTVRAFEDALRDAGRSPAMVRRARVALSTLVSDAMERGLVNRNVVRELSRKQERKADQRAKGRLEVGTDIPSPNEIRALLPVLRGRWRPLLMTAIFCGLRSSELRGLRWQDIDFAKNVVTVTQRADRFHKIGSPKSAAGARSVPMPPPVTNALTEWRLACPKGELDLAFLNMSGRIESHGNITHRGLGPAMVRAGIVGPDGTAKYTGMHALRHFYASWCINAKTDGGLGLDAKRVQQLMGHSDIGVTLNTYSHLFPQRDASAELAAAAAHLFVVA